MTKDIKVNWDAAWDTVNESAAVSDVIPKHWKDVYQLSALWNRSVSHTHTLVRQRVKAGVMITKRFKVVQDGKKSVRQFFAPNVTARPRRP